MTVGGQRLWSRWQTLARIGAVRAQDGGGRPLPAYGQAHVEQRPTLDADDLPSEATP